MTNNLGPSPRAWGKRRTRSVARCRCRTIPTRVGKTGPRSGPASRNPDHPHARGENLAPSWRPHSARPGYGPSPRAWGKLLPESLSKLVERTIPTRVGKTAPPSRDSCGCTDHPHARGENLAPSWRPHSARPGYGPSPRAWGKLLPESLSKLVERTIPTRVGKTAPPSRDSCGCTDHPHARGENLCVRRDLLHDGGPSPRAWGKLLHHHAILVAVRTIPTRVGKTCAYAATFFTTADHPHARGENASATWAESDSTGPSPRAWGKPSARVR